MVTPIGSIKKYFQKVGPLLAGTDVGTFDLQDPQSLLNFETALGAPSLSNYFKVSMELAPQNPSIVRPQGSDSSQTSDQIQQESQDRKVAASLNEWLTSAGCFDGAYKQRRFELLASEAALPGTNMQVVQEVGSRQGIRERFATQRAYTDIAISFYVTHDYKTLRLFQEWMNYMNPLFTGEEGTTAAQSEMGGYPSSDDRNAFYRFRYPNQYKRDIQITKFERDVNFGKTGRQFRDSNVDSQGRDYDNSQFSGPSYRKESYQPNVISYNFVNAFPISIQDIQLSYGAGQVLKVTVDFSYDRYFIVQSTEDNIEATSPLGITPPTLSS